MEYEHETSLTHSLTGRVGPAPMFRYKWRLYGPRAASRTDNRRTQEPNATFNRILVPCRSPPARDRRDKRNKKRLYWCEQAVVASWEFGGFFCSARLCEGHPGRGGSSVEQHGGTQSTLMWFILLARWWISTRKFRSCSMRTLFLNLVNERWKGKIQRLIHR